ncbi:hypothetical protein, partial [Halopseudomonas formosensis]
GLVDHYMYLIPEKQMKNPVGEGNKEQPDKQVNYEHLANRHLILSPLVYLEPHILTEIAAHAPS